MKKILKNEIKNLKNKFIIKCFYIDDSSKINLFETVIDLNNFISIILNEKMQKIEFQKPTNFQSKTNFHFYNSNFDRRNRNDLEFHIYENEIFLNEASSSRINKINI